MELTNADVVNIFMTAQAILNREDKVPVRFSYALSRIKAQLEPFHKPIEEAQGSSADFVEFQTKRVKLAQDYADKNEDGSPIIDGDSFRITTRRPEWESEWNALRKDYGDVIKIQEKRINDLQALLAERIDVGELYTLPLSTFPEELPGQWSQTLFQIATDDQ